MKGIGMVILLGNHLPKERLSLGQPSRFKVLGRLDHYLLRVHFDIFFEETRAASDALNFSADGWI
jgi:hypothetical protein